MAEVAPTNASLLIRIRNPSDQESWSTFVDVYGPLIFNFGRRKGLQESDAADLVQDVLQTVAKTISRFEYNPEIGKFRSWLYRIASRTLSRFLKKNEKEADGVGGTQAIELIESVSDQNTDLDEAWNQEYQATLMNWAIKAIRPKFKSATWKAFWLSSVEQRGADEVAADLGMSVGAVYIAKSRVIKAMSEKIREIDDSQ